MEKEYTSNLLIRFSTKSDVNKGLVISLEQRKGTKESWHDETCYRHLTLSYHQSFMHLTIKAYITTLEQRGKASNFKAKKRMVV